MNSVDWISHFSGLERLSRELRERLVRDSLILSLPAGAVIYGPGQAPKHYLLLLEGSVRRSGRTVRITTQLINGVTGFHLWSESYDRDLSDVLKLQAEIALGRFLARFPGYHLTEKPTRGGRARFRGYVKAPARVA